MNEKSKKREGAGHALEEQALESLVTAGILSNLANILVRALRKHEKSDESQ